MAIVLWAVLFFSVSIMGMISFVNLDVEEQGLRNKQFRARQLAESGLALGLHPQVERGDPLLNQTFNEEETEGFRVRIRSEGAFINLNQILNESQIYVLERLFTEWGLTVSELRVIIDSMLDWVDGDEFPRRDGAEAPYYFARDILNAPTNQPFTSLEEVKIVQGVELLDEVKPDWKRYFTVNSSGPVDVNSADVEVLMAITDATQLAAEEFVRSRWGDDEIPETEDDITYTVEEAVLELGVSASNETEYEQTVSLLSAEDSVKRIESTGFVAGLERTINVVADRRSTQGQFISWEEQ